MLDRLQDLVLGQAGDLPGRLPVQPAVPRPQLQQTLLVADGGGLGDQGAIRLQNSELVQKQSSIV